MKIILLFILLFATTNVVAQEFYFGGGTLRKVNLSSCEVTTMPTCGPGSIGMDDIAINESGDVFYLTFQGLKKKNINSADECEFLVNFNDSANALVAGPGATLYAACGYSSNFYSYDVSSGVLTLLGVLPDGIRSVGDLFFYEHRLFLTGFMHVDDDTHTVLVEVNIQNPSLSCIVATSIDFSSLSAFSLFDGTSSRAYLISLGNVKEINMQTFEIGETICDLNFSSILGAASYYPLVSANSVCSELGTSTVQVPLPSITINNPVKDIVTIFTDMNFEDMQGGAIYDMSGQLVKTIDKITPDINISELNVGIYLLEIKLPRSNKKTFKMVVE